MGIFDCIKRNRTNELIEEAKKNAPWAHEDLKLYISHSPETLRVALPKHLDKLIHSVSAEKKALALQFYSYFSGISKAEADIILSQAVKKIQIERLTDFIDSQRATFPITDGEVSVLAAIVRTYKSKDVDLCNWENLRNRWNLAACEVSNQSTPKPHLC